MKQIFDWLREQINEAHKLNKLRLGLGMRLDAPYNLFNEIINEAEAKWEADCCEWKKYEYDILFPYKTSCGHSEVFFDTFKYCPYCGKPIKISEVE